ncbi:unnamed protein product, partial [Chrysoparadoxa australica]
MRQECDALGSAQHQQVEDLLFGKQVQGQFDLRLQREHMKAVREERQELERLMKELEATQ